MTFVLNRESRDWKRLERDGFNLYPFDGAGLEMLVKNASYVLWTKDPVEENSLKGTVRKLLSDNRSKSIFLQHGTLCDISNVDFYFKAVLNKLAASILCSSDSEWSVIWKYSSGGILPVTLGMPRHDTLMEKNIIRRNSQVCQKQMMISFHWRVGWIDQSDENFVKSEYLNGVNAFLNDKKLEELHSNGVKILFIPHARFMKFFDYFKVPGFVECPTEFQFQDILVGSDVLVTDFSSNSFEMAYMDKPTISWIPDPEYVTKNMKSQYHMENIKNHPHIIQCQKKEQVFQELDKVFLGENYVFNVPLSTFNYRDMDNTRRLLDWMVSGKLD